MSEIYDSGSQVNCTHQPFEEAVEQLYDEMCHECRRTAPPQESHSCPQMFDVVCWSQTARGSEAQASCPLYMGLTRDVTLTRTCHTDGTWEPRKHYLEMCFPESQLPYVPLVGYLLSIVAILAALIIFIFFKSNLQSTRTRVRINLFASFLILYPMAIFWDFFIMDIRRRSILSSNPVWCQFYRILYDYITVCNLLWMFCEGLHLFLLLVIPLVNINAKFMKLYYVVGWIVPLMLVGSSYGLRYYEEQTKNCNWQSSKYDKVHTIPVGICVSLNVLILLYVIILLLKRLQPPSGVAINTRSMTVTIRAFFILVPLLGTHFAFFMLPRNPSDYQQAVFSVINSFQGLVVAILYCFSQEVCAAIRSAYRRRSQTTTMT